MQIIIELKNKTFYILNISLVSFKDKTSKMTGFHPNYENRLISYVRMFTFLYLEVGQENELDQIY